MSSDPPLERANRNTLWASLFVDELHRGGLRTAVLAPGSRSTPLVVAFARHPGIQKHLLLDERSAAFFALGHAKTTGRPVALLCTSGTAAANFHPAVLEAHLSQVPLVVLTADRPEELREVGAGQTVDQLRLYGTAVRWFFAVGTPQMTLPALRHLRGLAGRALHEAAGPPAGPVHLNFPFRKPLEPTAVPEDVPDALWEALAAERATSTPDAQSAPHAMGHPRAAAPDARAVRQIARQMQAARRGLIVCGPLPTPLEAPTNGHTPWPDAVARLARATGYPIIAEPPSGLRGGTHDTSRVMAHAEAFLRSPAFRQKIRPELVLRFGAMPTGKHVEVLLEEHPACPQVLVNEGGDWWNPTHHPATLVPADPVAFCEALCEALPPGLGKANSGYVQAFWDAERCAQEAVDAVLAAPAPEGLGDAWFEGRVFRELAALLPEGAHQFTASSMPVRDLEAFTPLTTRAVRHLVSRGANGIDGTLSTALGMAQALRERGAPAAPAVLVTGDIAFLHDSNGLQAAKALGIPLLVVLIDNDGGGIFHMLPIAQVADAFEPYFGTAHGTDFALLCAAHGVPVEEPTDWSAFREAVTAGLGAPGTRVIRLRTDRQANPAQHAQVWSAVRARVEAAFPPERRF